MPKLGKLFLLLELLSLKELLLFVHEKLEGVDLCLLLILLVWSVVGIKLNLLRLFIRVRIFAVVVLPKKIDVARNVPERNIDVNLCLHAILTKEEFVFLELFLAESPCYIERVEIIFVLNGVLII